MKRLCKKKKKKKNTITVLLPLYNQQRFLVLRRIYIAVLEPYYSRLITVLQPSYNRLITVL